MVSNAFLAHHPLASPYVFADILLDVFARRTAIDWDRFFIYSFIDNVSNSIALRSIYNDRARRLDNRYPSLWYS